MVYKLLSILFKSDYSYVRYTPKHQDLVYSVLMMALGTMTFVRDGWHYFGMITFALGASLGLVIIIGIAWDKAIEYWSTLDQFANTMMKSNNPDLWMALGFKAPPNQVTIQEVKQADHESGFSMKFHKLPVSPAIMQSIADKVLLSGNTDFIETGYKNIPNIRKVRDKLKAEGLLSPKNNKNVRLGYTFNRKGLDTLYEYASEGIKLELKRR